AAGALSGVATRHPVAVPAVEPIASGPDYASDVQRAQALRALVEEGHVGSLVEASLRFALSSRAVSTVLLGYSSLEHLEDAAAAPLLAPVPALTPRAALRRGVQRDYRAITVLAVARFARRGRGRPMSGGFTK